MFIYIGVGYPCTEDSEGQMSVTFPYTQSTVHKKPCLVPREEISDPNRRRQPSCLQLPRDQWRNGHTVSEKESSLDGLQKPATCLGSTDRTSNAQQVRSFNNLLMITTSYYYGPSDDGAMLGLSQRSNF